MDGYNCLIDGSHKEWVQMSLYFWIIWCDSLRHLVTLRPFIDILVRSECYKPQDTHLSPSVWLVFIEISVANLIHWSGLVVCCCFALWQWSSFIHDTDYCDNLNTESREASHWSHVHNEGLWLVVTFPFAFPAHATRHGAPMIRLSLSRSEIRRESSQEILST